MSVKTNLSFAGVVKNDPRYTKYDKDGGEEGAVCNFTVIETIKRSKHKPLEFQFVTFDPDLALLIASKYRKGDKIAVVRSWPYPCKDRQRDGTYADVLKWQCHAIETEITKDLEQFVDEGEPCFDDDIPPI